MSGPDRIPDDVREMLGSLTPAQLLGRTVEYTPPPRPTFVLVELKPPFAVDRENESQVFTIRGNVWAPKGVDCDHLRQVVERVWRRLLDEVAREAFNGRGG